MKQYKTADKAPFSFYFTYFIFHCGLAVYNGQRPYERKRAEEHARNLPASKQYSLYGIFSPRPRASARIFLGPAARFWSVRA